MTKIIEFNHRGQVIRSVAIFNFEQSQYSVMVMPYLYKGELGNTIVIIKDNGNWISESSIVDNYKLTYLNILAQIDPVIKEHEAFKNAYLQKFLS